MPSNPGMFKLNYHDLRISVLLSINPHCFLKCLSAQCSLHVYFLPIPKVQQNVVDIVISMFLLYLALYNNQINARALIGQSAMVYCAGKLMEKSRVF